MSKIPEYVQDKIAEAKIFIVATADKLGQIHLAAGKGLEIIDDKNVAFANWFCFKTLENLKENPSIAIGFIDSKTGKGYQLLGRVEAIHAGAILDGFTCECEDEESPVQYPQAQHELTIRISNILELSTDAHSDKDIE